MRLVQVFLAATLILFGCEYLTEQKHGLPIQVPPVAEDQPDPLPPADFPLFTVKSADSAAQKAHRALLRRDATPEEAAALVARLQTQRAGEWWNAIDAISRSQEFKEQIRPIFTDSQILDQIYQELLGRGPDPSAIEVYLPWIASGRISQAARAVAGSDEFVRAHFVYPSVSRRTIEKAVDRAYRAILFRQSDPEGLADYANAISEQGMSGWRQTLQAIAESAEFRENVRPNRSDEEILTSFFEQLLGRPMDPESQAVLTPLLSGGQVAEVVERVGTSDEYFERLLGLQDDRPAPPPGFKVAFTGDQGHFDSTRQVYRLIKQEGAELLVILGDFDYQGDPKAWEAMMNQELGPAFPLIGIVGNHDASQWSKPIGYRNVFTGRQAQMPGIQCSGDYGVNSTCVYKNLFFAMSGIGTMGSGHEQFLRNELPKTNHMWKICAWHKLQEKMQVGGKHDETGWPVYEICRENGAIVATAHEHSYSRTHLMSSFERQVVHSTSDVLGLERGKSFAFVSGLGGHTVRSKKFDWPWMAASHTSTQGGTHGVLFCSFNVGGREDRAECYFKNVRGEVVDRFGLVAPPG
ncbi:MAG TPA: metallophosphoesterase [Bdellovibrionota bacterium]|nr:metallophosphoesterase [Bdellovibrionota bacterium]